MNRRTQKESPDAFDMTPWRGVIESVEEPVDRDEVLRYLGYPAGVPPSAHIQNELERWIVAADERAAPQATYLVAPIAEIDRRLLRFETSKPVEAFAGAIGEFLGVSKYVAAFIATAGPGVERLASERMKVGDELAAMIVNAVGAERAEAAESVVIEELRERGRAFGLAPTLPYSPGYCGMALTEQRKLFALFGDETAGVTLTDDCLMRPLKSVSGLIGLGPADDVRTHVSPCDRCELQNCAMRR